MRPAPRATPSPKCIRASRRDRDNRTIDVILKIDQGPRVYIEKINIVGNTRTLDKVIRREFRLVEGDAFNRVLVDRSRTRIRGLGFFKDVDIKQSPGSQPDRTNLTVTVTEQSTGELSLGAGYSSTSSFVGEFSYTERNLFGRGQYMRASIQLSTISKQFQFSFTEPYFLDRPLAAGFDLYKVVTDYQQAAYQGDTTAAGFRFGFPTSEYGSVGLRYTYKIDKIIAVRQRAAGSPARRRHDQDLAARLQLRLQHAGRSDKADQGLRLLAEPGIRRPRRLAQIHAHAGLDRLLPPGDLGFAGRLDQPQHRLHHRL